MKLTWLERLFLCIGIIFFGLSGVSEKDWRKLPDEPLSKTGAK
jgi:hypothetical protein